MVAYDTQYSHPYSLAASASEVSLRRARPRRDPAARWVQPLDNPVLPPAHVGSAEVSFARFVSEALICDAAEALELAVRNAPSLIPGVQWAHFLALSEGSPAYLTLACSGGGANDPAPLTLPATEGIVGWVAETGMAAVEADASAHVSYSRKYEAALLGRSPVICLPVGASRLSPPATKSAGGARRSAPPSRERGRNELPPQECTAAIEPGGGGGIQGGGGAPMATVPVTQAQQEGEGASSHTGAPQTMPVPPPTSHEPSRHGSATNQRAQGSVTGAPDAGPGAPNPLAGVLIFTGRFGTSFGEAELHIARAIVDLVRARVAPANGVGASKSDWVVDVGDGLVPTPPSTSSSIAPPLSRPTSQSQHGGGRLLTPGGMAGGGRRRATREQLEASVAFAREELEAVRMAADAEMESNRAQLVEVHKALAACEDEREGLRAQVRSTQSTHAALLADHTQLVGQHRRAEAQIHGLQAEVDGLRGNEMRLMPDLQRWLALTSQLASMLRAAKDISSTIVQNMNGRAEAASGGNLDAKSVSPTASENASPPELAKLLSRFDAALEEALPNLVVAKPWLTELLRPLQASLHAIATNSSSTAVHATHVATIGDEAGASRLRTPAGRINTPAQPRFAATSPPRTASAGGVGGARGVGGAVCAVEEGVDERCIGAESDRHLPTEDAMMHGPGSAAACTISVPRSQGSLGGGGFLSTSCLDLDGITPLGHSSSSCAAPTNALPSRPHLHLPSPGPERFGSASHRSANVKGAAPQALLSRPSPIAKFAPGSFVPAVARGIVAPPPIVAGDAHFAHASRLSNPGTAA
jgi:hypothetical protein